ncbi:outer membrane lipoprotein-sorting protein [Pseudomonas sp. MWU15-20650]|uniref:outer membrane lipoprotein-sorting protein n=1 Tax=Pseudomonas sp. MWU15-20650 TaxID=2933107 RepID=UPI002010097B
MKRLFLGACLLFPSLVLASNPPAAVPDPKEVILRSEERPTGKDSTSLLVITLTDKEGVSRKRGFVWYHLSGEKGALDLQKFFFPRSIRNIATFNEEVKGSEDLQYLYLPAASRVRRVSSKHQTWVGSDLIYEDLQKLKLEDWAFRFAPSSVQAPAGVYVVDCTAKPSSNSAYAKRRYFIRDDGTYFPDQIDFFDASDTLIKRVERAQVSAYGDALYERFVNVTDYRNGHRTSLERKWVRVNTGLDMPTVSIRQMERNIEHFAQPSDLMQLVNAEMSGMSE